MKFRIGDFVEIVFVVGETGIGPYRLGSCAVISSCEDGSEFDDGLDSYGLAGDEPDWFWAEISLKLKRPPAWDDFIYETDSVKDKKIEHVKERA